MFTSSILHRLSLTACLTQTFPRHLSPIHSSLSLSIQNRYNQAKLSIHDRGLKVAAVVESLEREMELLCLTGVEDQLQADVRPTLELLRNAGIKVSMEVKHIYTVKAAKENQIESLHTSAPHFHSHIDPVFCSDLDADRGQAWDGYMHRQKLPFGLQKPRHPRLQTGMLFFPSTRCFDVMMCAWFTWDDTKH